MGRQYDEALIGAISSRSFITEKRGLEVQIRPVPDDEREHVLDPRILEVSRKKMRNVSMSPSWTSLIGMRHRPDKPTYRLLDGDCLLYTSPSPRDISGSRMPSSA